MCLISLISCLLVTRLSRIFSDYGCQTLKHLTDSDVQTFLEREKCGKKIRKEKPRVSYSVALIMALLTAISENRQLKDLPRADFGRVPEKFLLTVRTKSVNENFVYLKR